MADPLATPRIEPRSENTLAPGVTDSMVRLRVMALLQDIADMTREIDATARHPVPDQDTTALRMLLERAILLRDRAAYDKAMAVSPDLRAAVIAFNVSVQALRRVTHRSAATYRPGKG